MLQLDLSTAGQGHEKLAHIVDALALLCGHAHHQVETPFVLVDGTGGFTGEGRAQGAVEIADVEAVLRHARPIISHGDLRKTRDLLHLRFTCALHFAHDGAHAFGVSGQRVHVLTVDLHGHILADAGHQFIEAHLDRLGSLVEHAGQFA